MTFGGEKSMYCDEDGGIDSTNVIMKSQEKVNGNYNNTLSNLPET